MPSRGLRLTRCASACGDGASPQPRQCAPAKSWPPLTLKRSKHGHGSEAAHRNHDELTDDEVCSRGELDLASGEIRNIATRTTTWPRRAFLRREKTTSAALACCAAASAWWSSRVEADLSGRYSLTASELLELKGRAAKLFSRAPG